MRLSSSHLRDRATRALPSIHRTCASAFKEVPAISVYIDMKSPHSYLALQVGSSAIFSFRFPHLLLLSFDSPHFSCRQTTSMLFLHYLLHDMWPSLSVQMPHSMAPFRPFLQRSWCYEERRRYICLSPIVFRLSVQPVWLRAAWRRHLTL